jgi:hypothetical protein
MVRVQVGPPLKPLFLRGFLFLVSKISFGGPYWVPFHMILILESVSAFTLSVKNPISNIYLLSVK